MSRIFVNTQNEAYKRVTQNAQGVQFGLGVPTELSPTEIDELGQKFNEIFFNSADLLETKRKVQIIFDSFTDPKFFGDGAVKIDKVQKYIGELELEAQRIQNDTVTNALNFANAAGGAVGAGFAVQAAQAAYALQNFNNGLVGLNVANANLVGGSALQAGLSTLAKYSSYLAVIVAGVKLAAQRRQQGREDNSAPWKMTRADFPNITSQAIAGNSNRRSIERLYDSRKETDLALKRNQVSTEEAIALLVRETLADALFCISNPSGNAITPPEHPGPGGNGTERPSWVNKDALINHFPFKHVTTGSDKVERTYVNALIYLKNYIDLIDAIVNVQNQSLSRSPDVDQATINIPLRITLSTANVQLFDAMANAAREVIREKVLTFFDENREYKTLLNLGNDRQYVAESWRLAPTISGSVQLKLLTPLDQTVTVETRAFISRELAESVVDIVDFDAGPALDNTPYLRPFNMDSRNFVDNKMAAANVSLTTLGLATGSAGTIINGTTISYGDDVFRRWFTGDFKSSELNIDFTDYNNFIHFGSAYNRLDAFKQKLLKIEELTSASISSSVSSSTISLMLKAKEKENIIRNFDAYEQFLYYASQSIAYSASAYYVSSEVEYNVTGSWPKQSDGTVHSPNSTVAINWLTMQQGIAERYDDNNPNYLIKSLPNHIQEDAESDEFLMFFAMVGHLMDNIKVYIDQFHNIYSTKIDPLQELTMDQVYEVAQSFGLKLPNVYALENLQTFNAQFTGETGSRAYVAETWKRFLHSMVYFNKTKGSRTSFDALLNTYGISSPVLQIKETTYPVAGNYIKSDELTYGLQFTASVDNFVRVPFVSSSITASTLQLRFVPNRVQSSSLVTSDTWAIDLIPHPSASKTEYGKIHVVSGSGRTIIATSSYFPLFSDDYTNIMLRSQSGDITIVQTDGDQILFQESASVNLSSLWNSTTYAYVGGSGSIKLSGKFDGIIDEIRVWGENISDDDFISQAYDPGSYYGNSYTSSYATLFVHVPFSQPLSSITASVTNESPYQNVSIVSTLPATGFTTASFKRISRTVKQFTPIVGSTSYTNNKVVVAPAPVFSKQFIDESGSKVLSSKVSIKQIEDKQYIGGQNIVAFNISPVDFINQNIMRSMGVVDVNNIIGSPRYTTGSVYSSLDILQRQYKKYFNKTVNPNEYTRFFKDLVQGPSELADDMAPARAKLLDGIVIESSILSRNKDTLVRSTRVDGSNTRDFDAYVSGSGSSAVGAYDFSANFAKFSLLPSASSYTLPIDGILPVTDTVNVVDSTLSSKLPPFRKVKQVIGNSNVTSSLLDNNSSFSSIEALTIDTSVGTNTLSAGYARNPYLGIASRLGGEDNTLTPFYNIPPRSDLTEVGTTSYFHKESGKYYYDIYTPYRQLYTVRLDTRTDSPIDRVYAKVTLLPSSSIALEYGRNITKIAQTTYESGSSAQGTTGVIKIANIFSLYGVSGAPGLRVRMYASDVDRGADISRDFTTLPSGSSGVLFDGLLEEIPAVFPYVLMQTQGSNIYYTINNQTGASITSEIEFDYFAYEPDNLSPMGYLPRHYKFSRDNNTALKRRNYLGCRDTNSTFDNKPPFSVSISSEFNVVVNTNTTQTTSGAGGTVQIPEQMDTITFGGGGQLDVK